MVTYDRTTPELVAERIAGADVVITNKVPLRRDTLCAVVRLRLSRSLRWCTEGCIQQAD